MSTTVKLMDFLPLEPAEGVIRLLNSTKPKVTWMMGGSWKLITGLWDPVQVGEKLEGEARAPLTSQPPVKPKVRTSFRLLEIMLNDMDHITG